MMNKTAIIDGVAYNLVPVEKEVGKPWRAEKKGTFYIVGENSDIVECWEYPMSGGDYNYLTGNYFRTEEQAEQYKLLLEAKGRVRLKALELGGGEGIDFYDDEDKFTFSFSQRAKAGCQQSYYKEKSHPETYFYWTDSTKRDEFLVACKEDLEYIYNYNYLI